jgi:poly-gamma-glutamate capsule biosynthesis protein CapA/YwtB (metallophosphatase superfamily)
MKKRINVLLTNSLLVLLLSASSLSSKCDAKAYNKEVKVESVEDVDVMMIGDVLVHAPVYKSGIQSDGTLNYDHLFTNIKDDVNTSDISIVNQETILGGTKLGISSYPCFNSPQEIGDAEVKVGFNTVLHATNHALDKGLPGIESTLDFWRTKYPEINVLGLNETEEDVNKIYVYNKDGFKIAILNYTFSTNGIPVPKTKPYVVNVLDVDRVTTDIKKAKNMADMVIVCPHWGTEYTYTPDSLQKKYTELFSELGVDVVIGTHPHVLEPVEVIKNNAGHNMLVYYSLGNFISCQTEKPRMIGGMAKVTLEHNETTDTSYIKDYSLDPVVTQEGEYTTYKLSDYNDTLANTNKIRNHKGCSDFNMSYINNLCTDILGSDYNEKTYSLTKTLK